MQHKLADFREQARSLPKTPRSSKDGYAMKIQCQSCQAKYTIADEKVLGKVVKIRCKKCSATIVINGNEQPRADDAAENQAFDYANQSNEQWTVNVADGDQRTMTLSEIVTEYKAGTVNDETYCWKDGMSDWLPVREIDQLFSVIKGGVAQELSVPPQVTGGSAPLFASAGGGDSPFAASAHANGNGNGNGSGALFAGGGGGAVVEQHAPAAARRAGGRAQGADLFGNVEKAGGEDDVMTSAAAGAAAAAADEKLTGQRNENSVLFSLSALTDKKDAGPSGASASPVNRTTASADGSGLIDIRALSANMDTNEKKKDTNARVDDIMNLSGGGAFGAALAAPILAPPPLEPVDLGVTTSGAEPKQNKTLVFAILGGCAFIAIAIVLAVALTRGPAPAESKTTGSAATATSDPAVPGSVAALDTSTPPTGATAPTGDTPAPPGTGHNTTKPGAVNPAPKAAGNPGAAAAKPAEHTGAAAAAAHEETAKAPDKPQGFGDALAAAAGKKADAPAAPAPASGAPFDRGAAAAALGGVNVSSCKKPDGPSGAGHVTVTFGPDGSVQTAVVDSGPFPGTPVGGCIAGKYRGAHVPPFGGAPVRVGKSFTIN
jgi:predicted Zn finger-like uncharacterized protein